MKSTRRAYNMQDQLQFNEKLCININDYWKQFGYDAGAHVAKKQVFVPNAGKKGRNVWSQEIVSSVSSFPVIRRQILGIQ